MSSFVSLGLPEPKTCLLPQRRTSSCFFLWEEMPTMQPIPQIPYESSDGKAVCSVTCEEAGECGKNRTWKGRFECFSHPGSQEQRHRPRPQSGPFPSSAAKERACLPHELGQVAFFFRVWVPHLRNEGLNLDCVQFLFDHDFQGLETMSSQVYGEHSSSAALRLSSFFFVSLWLWLAIMQRKVKIMFPPNALV